METNKTETYFLSLPYIVVILALVGLLINISTTMIYSQLPMYMKNVLGATAKQATLIDGIVESFSHITRIVSGVISDVIQNRKAMLVVGYGLTIISKPIYLLSPSLMLVFCAQTLDRLANGIIASPRDALVGDVTNKPKRGASYGFLKSMKTAGSVIGALTAIGIMVLTADDFSMVFVIATVPAIIAFVLLIICIREPKKHKGSGEKKRFRINKEILKSLGKPFWKIIVLATFFELAHFSETLLSWRAHSAGVSTSFIAFVMVAMNVGQFLVAYPLGRMSDRFNRQTFLIVGFVFMLGSNLCLGFGESVTVVMIGVFLWGAQMSTTQSIFLSMISDAVDKEMRGTAFGVFYFTSGICYLISSSIAGHLWDSFGHVSAFLNSTAISAVSILLLLWLFRKKGANKVF